MTKTIAIRVDGNSEIGFGHLMRMKALARELDKLGAEVIFLSRNPENIKSYQALDLDCQVGDDEDLQVEKMLKSMGAQMFIIDSYNYTQERLNRAAELELVSVYIDDMNRHPFNTDFVINGNLYAPGLDYRGQARFLLGPEYLLMREEFTGLASRVAVPRVDNILITFGAADMENVTPGVLHKVKSYEKFPPLHWHVAIGPVFQNTGEIEAVAKDYPNISLHHNPDIKKLMDFCDISISAAGSTTYELAACGVPALLLIAADNQVMLAREAERQGIAFNLGWHQKLEPEKLYIALDTLLSDKQLRDKMAARGQGLIDGQGAQRVAAILMDEVRRSKHGHKRDDHG